MSRLRRKKLAESNAYRYIKFADEEFGKVSLANFDTTGNGKISYREANNVTSIQLVFRNNTNIESIEDLKYFKNVTRIAAYAFQNCTGLKSMLIPDNISVLEAYAFDGVKNTLTVFNFPKGVTTIGYSSLGTISVSEFVYIDSLEHWLSINFYNNLSLLGKGAYLQAGGVNVVDLDLSESSRTAILHRAFADYKKLNSVVLSPSITTIGAHAFDGCTSLTSINTENVEILGGSALSYLSACPSLNLRKWSDCTPLGDGGAGRQLWNYNGKVYLPDTPPSNVPTDLCNYADKQCSCEFHVSSQDVYDAYQAIGAPWTTYASKFVIDE